MYKKFREIWNRFDVWMMTKTANNIYLWDWWELVKNPYAWGFVIISLLLVFCAMRMQIT